MTLVAFYVNWYVVSETQNLFLELLDVKIAIDEYQKFIIKFSSKSFMLVPDHFFKLNINYFFTRIRLP